MSQVFIVTRHAGAQRWLAMRGIQGELHPHFDTAQVKPGDQVVGTLPIPLAADVVERGGVYFHLDLRVPPEYRGKELTAEDMDRFGAKITGYVVRRAALEGVAA